MSTSMTAVTRLNINLSERQKAQLSMLCEARDRNITAVVKDGLDFLTWLEETKTQGKTFCTKNPDGTLTEVVFL
jgi:hypothetical protein